MSENRPLRPKLTPKARQALKRRAHALKPVVLMGRKGLTDAVLAEIDRSLEAHELIKVRLSGDREERRHLASQIASHVGAELVQLIGKVAVFYRPQEDTLNEESHKGEKRRKE